MAAAVRCGLNQFTVKLLNNTFRQTPPRKLISKLSFHTSRLLNVVGQEVKMPSLSPTMADGTIVKWLKNEGDTVSPGDVLCEIQTDKAVMSFEIEEEGILAKILVREDVKEIKVGTVIALMVSEDEDWKSVELPGSDDSSSSSSSTGASAAPQATGGSVPGLNITMPSLSPTMAEGTIIKWHKKEGDTVSPGDVLCDIQTDKAVMSFETEEEGILAKILVPEGTAEVKIGTLIALMVGEGEDWKDVTIPGTTEASSISEKTDKPPTTNSVISTPSYSEPHNYGPAVLRLLGLYQINENLVTPSGKNKKLLKSDVLNYITQNKLQPKPPKTVPLPSTKPVSSQKDVISSSISTPGRKRPVVPKYIDIEVSSMRRTIAKRLTESKVSIPHAYATVESDIDLLLSFRKQLKSFGIVVSVNDFVVKAVALALRKCPHMNCLYANDQVISVPSVDISVAVATDSGLITPIVKAADGKSVDEISAEIKELAGRARKGKLQLHEFQGGSFTISNLGMFGISEFSAIINPPQCGILAIGSGKPTLDLNGKVVTKMTVMLSYDGRAISESAAADFLETLQLFLQNPASILIGTVPTATKAKVAN